MSAKPAKVILMIESSRASGRALLRGIAEYSHQRGPWTFSWETGGLEKAWPILRDKATKGIILRDLDRVADVLSYGLPTVVIGHQHTEIPGVVNVVTDSEAIGRTAAEHLIECGFKKFAFCGYAVTAMTKTPWSEARQSSFQACLTEHGFGEAPSIILPMDRRAWEESQPHAIRWLRGLAKPTGVFACNDDCGHRFMELCRLAGLTVPDEIGVLGTDNDQLVCELIDPPMSSIAMNFQRAGYEAALALDRLMKGHRDVPLRIITEAMDVVARRSTDFVAAEHANLRKALEFIRDNARRTLWVPDVVAASGLSRRGLEAAFRKHLGRSISQEVRRVRSDQIARLLIETDLSVSEIADALDFDFQHVGRYFEAVRKVRPTEFRRAHGWRKLRC
ncbi:MAG TPA: DNA-binding transcriptional regulator [Verrucomicrobiae bacterium]|jgi:LacI family transcriptional regulator|nr:DNA-binding transcriptional regulator [Verrucomicrobiae bacterium]